MGQLETGIRNALLADATIAAAVATRIRPLGMSHDDERPYITYQVTSRESDASLSGDVDDYHKVEFEIGAYADTYGQVMDLSDAARERLDQFGETVSTVEFAPCQFVSETDIVEQPVEGAEMPVYLRVQNYKALYRIVS